MNILEAEIMLKTIKYRPGYTVNIVVGVFYEIHIQFENHKVTQLFGRGDLMRMTREEIKHQVYTLILNLERCILNYYLVIGGEKHDGTRV